MRRHDVGAGQTLRVARDGQEGDLHRKKTGPSICELDAHPVTADEVRQGTGQMAVRHDRAAAGWWCCRSCCRSKQNREM